MTTSASSLGVEKLGQMLCFAMASGLLSRYICIKLILKDFPEMSDLFCPISPPPLSLRPVSLLLNMARNCF